jgi:hypothetical protein
VGNDLGMISDLRNVIVIVQAWKKTNDGKMGGK